MENKNLGFDFCRGMKKALPYLSAVALFLTSSQPCMADLKGNFQQMESSDSILVFVDDMVNRQLIRVDTVGLSEHRFQLDMPDVPVSVQIVPKPKGPNGALRMMSRRPLLHFPGDHILLEGSLDDMKVSGSEIYDGLNQMTEIQECNDKLLATNKLFYKAYEAKDEARTDSLKKVCDAIYNQLNEAKLRAVQSRPDSKVAAYLAMGMSPEAGLKAISLLTETAKQGVLGKMVEQSRVSYEQHIAREKAQKNIAPGKPAPDFKMKTIDGKEVTLSTFKGKYLLIDFWGTWCGWCIKGIPDMKKYYAQYKDKIEFLGVCCRDSEEKWRAGVAKYQLPWVNVCDEKSDLSTRYAVPGYPTKVLVDAEGKIVEVFVGESPALYEKLDKLFK